MGTKQYHFQKLTPVSDSNIDVYNSAIDFSFSNGDIKNVAISGPYSAGKSSVLETYKKEHVNKRFVHISLAHFNPTGSDLEQADEKQDGINREAILERKILNQLLHQVPASKIPQTKFQAKKGISGSQLFWLTLFTFLLLGSFVYMIFYNSASGFVSDLQDDFYLKPLLTGLFSRQFAVYVAIIFVICMVMLIRYLIRRNKNNNIFKKISLQGNEIELDKERDDSYFDKYLNEVLYLFENVDADVIVFEDIDRFNSVSIFERLHEINTLVNIQRIKKNDASEPLRFFYLMRDDIFTTKDRTKFFDFIIPVVPIVDSSNSYDQFVKMLRDGGIEKRFDTGFLQSITLYLDDMRILKNVYNEFLVYIDRIDADQSLTDLNWDKMMAMIVYKNLFPHDFSELQLGRGYVHTLFEQKPELVSQLPLVINERKAAIEERIELARKEVMQSKEEIEIVFMHYISLLPKNVYNGRLTNQGEAKNAELQSQRKKRLKAIEDNTARRISALESELDAVNREITSASTMSLKELINCIGNENREQANNIFENLCVTQGGVEKDFSSVKINDYFDLLKFLIRNGYIDETYNDYMTYFYAESFCAGDKSFIRRITDLRGADYKYVIKEPEKVLQSDIIRIQSFSQEETLNFSLLECLLISRKHDDYLNTLIFQLRDTQNFGFISQFISTKKAYAQFVVKINELWPEFFFSVEKSGKISAEQIREFSICTLSECGESNIESVNIENCLTRYISEASDYLNIDKPKIKRIIAGLKFLNVSFLSLDYNKSNKQLFDKVYEASLYSLTFENIALMIRVEFGIEDEYQIEHRNFTLIHERKNSSLFDYALSNISGYIELIIRNCKGSIEDVEAAVLFILNHESIDVNHKIEYITLLTTPITVITEIANTELWPQLLGRGVVKFSIGNLMAYFLKHGLDEPLVQYINSSPTDASFAGILDDANDSDVSKLFKKVVLCNELDNQKYKTLVNDLKLSFREFSADGISPDKLSILIDDGLIKMDSEGLKFIREKYPFILKRFVMHDFEGYLRLLGEGYFMRDEAIEFLDSEIGDEKSILILKTSRDLISVVGKNYSDELTSWILSNRLEQNDKPKLYEQYGDYGEKTKSAIQEIAIKNIDTIITRKTHLHRALMSYLLTSAELTWEKKISLFTALISNANKSEEVQAHLAELGYTSLSTILFPRSRERRYDIDPELDKILYALKAAGWIDYSVSEKENKYIVKPSKSKKD